MQRDDHVARREVGEGVQVEHERNAVVVAQDRALAPQRFREQRARHRRVVQRRRVELHEFEVGARNAGLQRQRDPVAGREGGIGRDREALTRAAGGEHGVDRAHELDLTVGPQRQHAGAPVALDEQLDGEPAFAYLDVGVAHRGHERPLDLGAGRVAARVHHPGE